MVGYVAGTVGSANAYLKKLLNISIFLGVCLTISAYGWLDSFGISFAVAVVFAFIPVIILLILRSKLNDIEALPAELEDLENVAGQIGAQLRAHNLSGQCQAPCCFQGNSFWSRHS